MASVVLVHGIWNRQQGMEPQEAAKALGEKARENLACGLKSAGLGHVTVPEVAMAYYAHLLADDREVQDDGTNGRLEALSPEQLSAAWEWLRAAGVPEPEEPQAAFLAPVRQGLSWLVRHRSKSGLTGRVLQDLTERLSRVMVALLQDTDAYTSRPQRRQAVREAVAEAIHVHRPQVVIAHSLGSMVAYETLPAFPELEVERLVTIGSPLGLPALMRKLDPEPRGGRGVRPSGVGSWVNIADVGDLVAMPPELGDAFPVDVHATTDIGVFDAHTLGGYLSNGLTAAAIAPYLPS